VAVIEKDEVEEAAEAPAMRGKCNYMRFSETWLSPLVFVLGQNGVRWRYHCV